MTIIETNVTASRDIYNLTKAPGIMKMSDVKGQRLEIAGYCIYEDVNSSDVVQTILSLSTTDGEVYATNSPTFIREFKDASDIAGPDLKAIQVGEGISRSGRTFISCKWID